MYETILINGIVKESVVDGPGLRYTIFTQGCKHNCDDCHNPQTHDLNGGYEKSIQDIVLDVTSNPMLDGITFSGGEPLLHYNELFELSQRLKFMKPKLNIILYTGFTYEELLNRMKVIKHIKEFIEMCDFIVDGRFIKNQQSDGLKFKGSANQNVYAIHKFRNDLENPIIDNNWETYNELK